MSHKNRKKQSKARSLLKEPVLAKPILRTKRVEISEAKQMALGAKSSQQIMFDGQMAPMSRPSISLCMIVKNEEENLVGCLASVGDFADEIIVVDTGSSDRTVEIAESFGARVKHFRWIDDFAAARNESIKDARGDWIFWMDADDRISSENLIRLKQAVASGKADAYYCYVTSQLEDEKVAQVKIEHLRLFRNRLGVHFMRPLHEDAAPVAHRLGLTIARTNIVVEHIGYVASREVLQKKSRRNLQIIQKALAEDPDDLYWRFHLGFTLHILGDLAGSIEHLEAVVANPPPFLDRDVYLYQAYEGLILAYIDTGQPDKARQMLKQMMREFSDRRHFWVRAGIVYLALDEPEQAVAAIEHAKTLKPDAGGQSWAAGTIETHLYQAYLLLGDLPKATEAYLALLAKTDKAHTSVSVETWWYVQTLFGAKRYNEVIELLESVAEANSSALRLLAKAQAAGQNWEEAARCLAGAIALTGPHPDEWAELAKYTLQANRARHAQRYCHLALAEDSQNANALNLLGIIALAQERPSQALAYFVEAILSDPDNELLRHNLNRACQSLNLSPVTAIRQHGLQLMKQSPPNYTQAAAIFSLIIELAPLTERVEAYKLMAVALQKMGQEKDALLCWQTAQQLIAELDSSRVESATTSSLPMAAAHGLNGVEGAGWPNGQPANHKVDET